VTRLVQVFDRPCCGPSAAATMVDFLRERVDADEVSVEYHNLAEGGGRHVRVPNALVAHLSDGGALPVIAVDGELVATGALPNLMDALDLANGKPVPAMTPLSPPSDCC
jgi:hypothetical protein